MKKTGQFRNLRNRGSGTAVKLPEDIYNLYGFSRRHGFKGPPADGQTRNRAVCHGPERFFSGLPRCGAETRQDTACSDNADTPAFSDNNAGIKTCILIRCRKDFYSALLQYNEFSRNLPLHQYHFSTSDYFPSLFSHQSW